MAKRDERLYRIWYNMQTRCYNKKHERFPCYGGKGIKVCDIWLNSYEAFKKWALNNGYTDELTIDRIDSDKDYCPDNCRWISLSFNSIRANGENVKYKAISPEGEVYLLTGYTLFCKEHGLNRGNVSSMINGKNHVKTVKGWTIQRI